MYLQVLSLEAQTIRQSFNIEENILQISYSHALIYQPTYR